MLAPLGDLMEHSWGEKLEFGSCNDESFSPKKFPLEESSWFRLLLF